MITRNGEVIVERKTCPGVKQGLSGEHLREEVLYSDVNQVSSRLVGRSMIVFRHSSTNEGLFI
jgi:hypothetical protein